MEGYDKGVLSIGDNGHFEIKTDKDWNYVNSDITTKQDVKNKIWR